MAEKDGADLRLVVHKDRCMGHARCHAMAPDIFPLDDEGYLDLETATLDPAHELGARDGEAACPERAIEVVKSAG